MKDSKQILEATDLQTIAVFMFRVIQNSVRIDKLLLLIISKFEWQSTRVPLEEMSFEEKISCLYLVLEEITKSQGIEGKKWRDTLMGNKMIQFTPRKLKTVLKEIGETRNQFAHEFLVINEKEEMDLDGFNPGIVEFFLNPKKVGQHISFPSDIIKLKINPLFLKQKKIDIKMGEHFGLDPQKTTKKFSTTDVEFENYDELFKYFDRLETYAIDCLNNFNKILNSKEV